jgi:hypothetical protein
VYLGADERKQFEDDDRRATELANRGGFRPKMAWGHVAIIVAVGVFMLLDVFAAITLPDREAAFWPVIILTAICSATASGAQRWREKAWLARYSEAMLRPTPQSR